MEQIINVDQVEKKLLNKEPKSNIKRKTMNSQDRIMEEIKDTIRKGGYKCPVLKDAPVLVVGFQNSVENENFVVMIGALDNGYEVFVKENLTVPADSMPSVNEYLMRANANIRHGAYRLNNDTGAVIVTHSVFCGYGGSGTGCVLLMLYAIAHAHMAFGGTRLEAVMNNEISPADAAEDGAELYKVMLNPVVK